MLFKAASRFEDLPPYKAIEPYDVLSERMGLQPDAIVKLDANENPYGASPNALAALASLRYAHIYPDPENRKLRMALENFSGVPFENLFAGSGADELIDLLLRVMLEPGDKVLNCPPTFGMYEFDTYLNFGELIEIRRRYDFSLDLGAVVDAVNSHQPKILFLTSPNNPDGGLIGEDVNLLLELPVLVVLDEAYIEFTQTGSNLGKDNSLITQASGRNNLVVLRTFSKWAGLAGLRVGYGAFPNWLLPTLWKAKQPYNVNVAASEAAIASLNDWRYLSENLRKLVDERQRLFIRLEQIPYLRPFPSSANFILCKVIDRSAQMIKDKLEEEGILVRHYQTPMLQNMIRISVGRPQDSDKLIEKLEGMI
jgi:histidinol-phosphate aminotransferase